MTRSASLFSTVPKTDYFHFFEKGEINPQGAKVVNFLKYKKEDVSIAANVPVASVRYDEKMPQELKDRLIQWANAINLVGSFF